MKRLLAALVVTLGLAGLAGVAHAVCDSRTTTCFTNVDVSGTLSTGSSNITTTPLVASDVNATYGVTAATITASGLLTLGSSTAYSIKISSKTAAIPSGTPSAAGLIAFDSTYVMYVSTGTGAGAWVKIGGQ